MKIAVVIDYISYLIKKYGEIQQLQMKNTFRVASIKHTPTGNKIIFQVIGKSTFMECTPAEILSNDAFIERFSKKDVQKITYVYAQEENLKHNLPSPDLKLVEQEFNIHAGRTKFVLKDQDGRISSKTAIEIVKDKKIVKKLTQHDAMNIGFIAGYEHFQNDEII